MNLQTEFETERGSRYLAALCHHFARKVDAHCDASSGWVRFPFGHCDLKADETQLSLQVTASSQGDLDKIVRVMTSHLERFAFRENPDLKWQMAAN